METNRTLGEDLSEIMGAWSVWGWAVDNDQSGYDKEALKNERHIDATSAGYVEPRIWRGCRSTGRDQRSTNCAY